MRFCFWNRGAFVAELEPGRGILGSDGRTHQANIVEVWPAARLRSIGIYPFERAVIPPGQIPSGVSYAIVSNTVVETFTGFTERPGAVGRAKGRAKARVGGQANNLLRGPADYGRITAAFALEERGVLANMTNAGGPATLPSAAGAVVFTFPQMQALLGAIGARDRAIYLAHANGLDAIDALTTLAAVEAFVVAWPT